MRKDKRLLCSRGDAIKGQFAQGIRNVGTISRGCCLSCSKRKKGMTEGESEDSWTVARHVPPKECTDAMFVYRALISSEPRLITNPLHSTPRTHSPTYPQWQATTARRTLPMGCLRARRSRCRRHCPPRKLRNRPAKRAARALDRAGLGHSRRPH
jgi:hypothetical protein